MGSSTSGTQYHSSQDFWEAIEILKENATGYLVKWAGLDPATKQPWPDSWVAKEDCTKQLISEWKAKQKLKKRGRKRKNDIQKATSSKSRSQSLGTTKSETPDRDLNSLSPNGVKPIVEIKRKQRPTVPPSPSASDYDQPKKRRKISNRDSNRQGSHVIQVGPPGRAQKYVTNRSLSDAEHEVIPVTYKRFGKIVISESSGSRRPSLQRSASVSVGDSADRESEADNQPSPLKGPPIASIVEQSQKKVSSQEIIQETQPSHSTSSQSLQSAPKERVVNGGGGDQVTRRGSEAHQTMNPVPVISASAFRTHVTSPIQSFSSSQKSRNKGKKIMRVISSQSQSQNDDDDEHDELDASWMHERQEEEETQGNPPEEEGEEEEGMDNDSRPSVVSSLQSASNHKASIPLKERKPSSGASALTSIFGRLGKVFKSIEPSNNVSDVIENSTPPVPLTHSQVEPTNEYDLPQDDDDALLFSRDDDPNTVEMYDHDEAPGRDAQNSVDSDIDELGPEDAADAIGSSITESQVHQGANSSLVVNAAQTQSLPPLIESPVRQLDSALGLLHRKSEEIQLLQDQLTQTQEELTRASRRIALFEQQLDREEEQRDVQNLHIAQLQAELVSARSDVAVKTVERALSASQEYDEAEKDRALLDGSGPPNSDALERLQEEVERLKAKVNDLERENYVFRNLYAQASNSHMDNLEQLRHVERDNASLRIQATTGVRQANVFWQAQISTLERKLKKTLGESQLLIAQSRATEAIRERAALLPIAQKETEKVRNEVEEWKERFAQLGRENTSLRIELKARDDADLARRRKEREAEEQKRRVMEMHGDELLWICQWRDDEHHKCGALLDSRESLREHCYKAGHI